VPATYGNRFPPGEQQQQLHQHRYNKYNMDNIEGKKYQPTSWASKLQVDSPESTQSMDFQLAAVAPTANRVLRNFLGDWMCSSHTAVMNEISMLGNIFEALKPFYKMNFK